VQLRRYRRNQVFGLVLVALAILIVACCAPIRSGFFRRGGGGRESCAGALAVLLLGPTGSGKTVLSLELGERFSGEIVSCDSVAVYRGMDLGTAKPTKEERRGCRIT